MNIFNIQTNLAKKNIIQQSVEINFVELFVYRRARTPTTRSQIHKHSDDWINRAPQILVEQNDNFYKIQHIIDTETYCNLPISFS